MGLFRFINWLIRDNPFKLDQTVLDDKFGYDHNFLCHESRTYRDAVGADAFLWWKGLNQLKRFVCAFAASTSSSN